MEITIHEEKISHFTFHGKKKGRSLVTKIPFTTLKRSNILTQLYNKPNYWIMDMQRCIGVEEMFVCTAQDLAADYSINEDDAYAHQRVQLFLQ